MFHFKRTREGTSMRTAHSFSGSTGLALAVALGIALSGVNLSPAQVQPSAYSTDKSTMAKSRAEQEAEQRVALSPDKIIELLRQEPGLLLQVKKMLVRKAYEQGRILDPEDLTDEAVFQLLTEDHNICVLATREIEDRSYVRAKPTQEEIERQRESDGQYGITRTASPSVQRPVENNMQKVAANQEDKYWDQHDSDFEPYISPESAHPNPNAPTTTPRAPQSLPPNENPSRQLNMADLSRNQDLYDGMGIDSGTTPDSGLMTRIVPDQLPNLLNASSSSTSSIATLGGAAAIRDRGI